MTLKEYEEYKECPFCHFPLQFSCSHIPSWMNKFRGFQAYETTDFRIFCTNCGFSTPTAKTMDAVKTIVNILRNGMENVK